MSAMGRPKKLQDDRIKYTLYLDSETRSAIDEYVFQMKQSGNAGYSRSDFLNEAARYYLAALKRKGAKKNEH